MKALSKKHSVNGAKWLERKKKGLEYYCPNSDIPCICHAMIDFILRVAVKLNLA